MSGLPTAPVLYLGKAVSVTRRPDGLDVWDGTFTLCLTALADGIIRVRLAPDGVPERPSWAVLPGMRQTSVPVTHDSAEAGLARFATAGLQVTLHQDPLHLTIADASGTVLIDDVPGRPARLDNKGVRAWKTSPANEHYFGLGDKHGRLDRRGRAFQLWNTDDPMWRESSDPLYKAIPFVLGLRAGCAWGLLFDNTWRSSFDFCVAEPDVWSFGASGGALDYYVLAGPEPKAVLARYAALTGAPPLPPLWSLGYQQSRNSYRTEGRVREIVRLHRDKRIPLDVIYLDIGFQDRNRPFTTDPAGFPDLHGLTSELASTGVRIVAITDLHIAEAPDGDYVPYDTGTAGDHFLRKADGRVFVGESWPGHAVFPGFSRPDTRAWWGELYRGFYLRDGIAGFWNDMNEPSVRNGPNKTMPMDVQHSVAEPGYLPYTASHAEQHNCYGLQNSQATFEGLLALDPDRRPFVLTRASYAGGQRWAATWTGDNVSTWVHLRLAIQQLLSLGISGFALVGADVGGFQHSPAPDLLTRWVQLGAFIPLFRNHTETGTADQEIWVHGPEHETLRRAAIEARYRLLPYLYTLQEEAARTGVPPMRAMPLEFPSAGLEQEDSQFMLGSALLVVPWPDETTDAFHPTLPAECGWFDYWTGRAVLQPDTVWLPKDLDQLAVFVRAGSIVPHQPLVQSTAEVPTGTLQLHIYPGPGCRGTLYCDDGISHHDRNGVFLRQHFTCTEHQGGVEIHLSAMEGAWHPWWTMLEILLHGMTSAARTVLLDGQVIDKLAFEPDRHAVRFSLPVGRNASTVTVLRRAATSGDGSLTSDL